MITNRIYTDVDHTKDRKQVEEANVTGKDMVALTIAAYQILFPFLAAMLFTYGGIIFLFKIITR